MVDVMKTRTKRWTVRRAAVGLAALGLVVSACSLIVQTNTNQCNGDGDCKPYGEYSLCSAGICVIPSDGGTCFMGDPMTDPEFFNQCTDAGCEPFDNCARLGLCGDDAGLPPLIPPGDGGL
jgi:hypothetical protein